MELSQKNTVGPLRLLISGDVAMWYCWWLTNGKNIDLGKTIIQRVAREVESTLMSMRLLVVRCSLCQYAQKSRSHYRRQYKNRGREDPYRQQIHRDGKETCRDLQRFHSQCRSRTVRISYSQTTIDRVFQQILPTLQWGNRHGRYQTLNRGDTSRPSTLVPNLFEQGRIRLEKGTQQNLLQERLTNSNEKRKHYH